MKNRIGLLVVLPLLIGGGNFFQGLNAEVKHVIWPDEPVGLNKEIFDIDKVAYGVHLAEAMSGTFYPADEAKLTLFRSGSYSTSSYAYKFVQDIAGLPVVNGMIVTHTNEEGEIFYRRGPVLKVEDGSGKIDPPTKAFLEAVSVLHDGKSLDQIEYQSSCYFYDKDADETLSAHVLYIDTRDGVDWDSRKIIVDADSIKILSQQPLLIPAKDRDIYDCAHTTTLPGTLARGEGDSASGVADVNDAYDSSGLTWDLFDDRFDRDSWGDGGETIEAHVRYGYVQNAGWDSTNDRIIIGGGSQDFAGAYDVMAHELSHGVADAEGLNYTGDAAALHESFGDCMAAVYDYDNSGTVWEFGEDLVGVTGRYLDDPDAHNGADYIDEIVDLANYQHFNSGVPTLAFYLASEGGTHPQSESVIDVNGSGITNASDTLYFALTLLYASAQTLEEAAVDQTLAGFGISYSVGCSFASGWYAVGVDDAFWHGGIDSFAPSYMGWVWFASNGTQFVVDNTWHSYTDYDTDDGGMSVYSFGTTSWYWVSAETFPLYYDHTTEVWDTFSGTFE